MRRGLAVIVQDRAFLLRRGLVVVGRAAGYRRGRPDRRRYSRDRTGTGQLWVARAVASVARPAAGEGDDGGAVDAEPGRGMSDVCSFF